MKYFSAIASPLTPVLTIMQYHRVVAFFLGILMVFFPGPMHCGCLSRSLSHYEELTLRMWGLFVFFLSHSLHTWVVLGTPVLRLQMAKGLCAMFTAGSSIYLYERIFNREEEPTIAVLYVGIFGSLAIAYGMAIVKEPTIKEESEKRV